MVFEKVQTEAWSGFPITARGLMTPEINVDLRNLQGFQFRQHERIEAPQERLDILSSLVNRQIWAIFE